MYPMGQMTRMRHVMEVGAGDGHSSLGLPWATHADKVSLYEPNQLLWADLNRAAAGMNHVTVHPCAVSNTTGIAQLVHLGYASYLAGAPSFLRTSIEDEGEQWFKPLMRGVVVADMKEVDRAGDVDMLVLTPNGVELEILSAMVSRPKVIYTKHYMHNAEQCVHNQRVFGWLEAEDYRAVVVETNMHNTFYHLSWTKWRTG
jgi:hypothetical protein